MKCPTLKLQLSLMWKQKDNWSIYSRVTNIMIPTEEPVTSL